VADGPGCAHGQHLPLLLREDLSLWSNPTSLCTVCSKVVAKRQHLPGADTTSDSAGRNGGAAPVSPAAPFLGNSSMVSARNVMWQGAGSAVPVSVSLAVIDCLAVLDWNRRYVLLLL
jgi:hypothetical protein